MNTPIQIFPSILAADFGILQLEIDSIQNADGIHIDVMDGHFVPNLSFWAPVIKNIQTNLYKDVHLMVTNPWDRFDEFIGMWVNRITFHAECYSSYKEQQHTDVFVSRTKQTTYNWKDIQKHLTYIQSKWCDAGIVINPSTEISPIVQALNSWVIKPDTILIMSVEPGFGWQTFKKEVLSKVEKLRQQWYTKHIQIDGGIDQETIQDAISAWANQFVAGSEIFGEKSNDRNQMIDTLRNTLSA